MNILFDLDGTLTDPFEGIFSCFDYSLTTLGFSKPIREDIVTLIGPPLEESFRFLTAGREYLALDGVRLFRERYAATGLYQNTVYPGVIAGLKKMQESEIKLFVATSKPQHFAETVLSHFQLSTYFENIYGSTDVAGSKEEIIRRLLDLEKLEPKRTIMIGDRKHDIHGATANALKCIGVLWGYGTRVELEQSKAYVLCERFEDLQDLAVRALND